jgi:carbonic anhydrase
LRPARGRPARAAPQHEAQCHERDHRPGGEFPEAGLPKACRSLQPPGQISCADSRIVPELILQAEPGDLFVTRNAGNIVPPFGQVNGGVSSAVEYAVVALGISEIIVCAHSDCGAMKALLQPGALEGMPNVAAWLRHAQAAQRIAHNCYPQTGHGDELIRALTLENVGVQLNHLRTHPSVAAGIARGEIALHGWFVDIHRGVIQAMNTAGDFETISEGRAVPVALPRSERLAARRALELARA